MNKSNEDGFILLFVVIVTAMLLLMGFSAIILSNDDYEMKIINSTGKKNFYTAEAAIEEADMIIHQHIEESISYSYETLLELDLEDDLKSQEFKKIYKSQMGSLSSKLKDIDSYRLKNREKKEFTVDMQFIEVENPEVEFQLTLTAVCSEKGIRESIEVKYQIMTPEYMDFDFNSDLVKRKSWVNNKW